MFNPELPCRTPGSYLRRFAWGDANVLDPEHTDFQLLREAILDTHTKVLRTSTREVFYERYRTERLLAKQKV
jgi:septin family protein